MTVRQMSEVQLHTRVLTPFQRHFVNGDRPLTAVHGGVVVVGRIQMCAVVAADAQCLHCPAFPAGQILRLQPRKKAGDLACCHAVIEVIDFRQHDRRIGRYPRLERNRYVNKFAGFCHHNSPVARIGKKSSSATRTIIRTANGNAPRKMSTRVMLSSSSVALIT